MMQFSQSEKNDILRSYKNAKNPLAQIKVLAELNACKTNDIKAVLIECGVNEDDIDMRKLPKSLQTKRKTVDGQERSSMSYIVDALRREKEQREKRLAEIPAEIEALQTEMRGETTRIDVIAECIKMLTNEEGRKC